MGQYQVRHQCDRTCADCIYYDYHERPDDFGPVIDEYCDKGHYGHVGYYSEPCKDFMSEGTEDILHGKESESIVIMKEE